MIQIILGQARHTYASPAPKLETSQSHPPRSVESKCCLKAVFW